jgi:hypothetical protein
MTSGNKQVVHGRDIPIVSRLNIPAGRRRTSATRLYAAPAAARTEAKALCFRELDGKEPGMAVGSTIEVLMR